jgi:hypothetical protein
MSIKVAFWNRQLDLGAGNPHNQEANHFRLSESVHFKAAFIDLMLQVIS